MLKRSTLLSLVASCLLLSTASLARSLVNVTVHQSLIEKSIQIPVDETKPVSHTTSDGVNVQGSAHVKGRVTGQLKPEEGGAGLTLKMDTQTVTSSRQSTWPRRNIFISFDWDITTETTTYKRLALRTDGIFFGDAVAYSDSSINYGTINAEATGVFPRLTAAVALRAAQKEIYGRHGQSVADANQSVGSELGSNLDKQVQDMLASAKETFARFVQGPFVRRKLLGGSVAFGGDEKLAQIRVEDSEAQQGPVINPLAVSEGEPIAAELHPLALETFLGKTFGGAVFTDMELIELVFDQALPINSADDIHQRPEELLVHFDEVKPVSFSFKKDEVIVTARGSRVETLGKSWSSVDIKRVFKIKRENGKLILSFMDPWMILGRDGTVIDPVFEKHMISRLDEILPPGELDITGFEIGKGLPFKLKLAALEPLPDSIIAKLSLSAN